MPDHVLLGAPIWLHPNWPLHLMGGLKHYAEHFNTVEVNASFYAIPSKENIEHWGADTPEHFRFCFKTPQIITHEKLLANCQAEMNEFLSRIEPLKNKLGPIMVQLPPTFGPQYIQQAEAFIDSLPGDFLFAFEFRHPGFIDKSDFERRLNRSIHARGFERVTFDTRPLFQSTETQMQELPEYEKEFFRIELDRKPNIEVRPFGFSDQPLVRIISSPDIAKSKPALEQWKQRMDQWLEAGKQPYLFCHVPNEQHIPNFLSLAQEVFGQEQYESPQIDLF